MMRMSLGRTRVSTARPLPPVLDARDFLRWVRTQPPDRVYTYTDPEGCPVGEYLRSLGYGRTLVGPWDVHQADAYGAPFGPAAALPHQMFRSLVPPEGRLSFYGDLADRLERMLADE